MASPGGLGSSLPNLLSEPKIAPTSPLNASSPPRDDVGAIGDSVASGRALQEGGKLVKPAASGLSSRRLSLAPNSPLNASRPSGEAPSRATRAVTSRPTSPGGGREELRGAWGARSPASSPRTRQLSLGAPNSPLNASTRTRLSSPSGARSPASSPRTRLDMCTDPGRARLSTGPVRGVVTSPGGALSPSRPTSPGGASSPRTRGHLSLGAPTSPLIASPRTRPETQG